MSLDLRSWDKSGRPFIENVTVARGADPKGTSVESEHIRGFPVAVRDIGPGEVAITGPAVAIGPGLPPSGRTWVITCWGSVGDRVTDPAVVARIVSGPPVHH